MRESILVCMKPKRDVCMKGLGSPFRAEIKKSWLVRVFLMESESRKSLHKTKPLLASACMGKRPHTLIFAFGEKKNLCRGVVFLMEAENSKPSCEAFFSLLELFFCFFFVLHGSQKAYRFHSYKKVGEPGPLASADDLCLLFHSKRECLVFACGLFKLV